VSPPPVVPVSPLLVIRTTSIVCSSCGVPVPFCCGLTSSHEAAGGTSARITSTTVSSNNIISTLSLSFSSITVSSITTRSLMLVHLLRFLIYFLTRENMIEHFMLCILTTSNCLGQGNGYEYRTKKHIC
jgi:hypothetical protein